MISQSSRLEDRPLFICGLPRTGTSLLLSLFDGHPELVVASHEAKFFLTFLPRVSGLGEREKLRLAEETLFLVWRKGDYREKFLSHVSMDEVFAAFRRRLEQSPKRDADYLTCSVLAYGEASGQLGESSLYWVEKTPYTEQFANFIFSTWPESRCIQMVRDPRDLLFTYQNRDRHHGRRVTSLSSVVYSWRKSAALARRNRRLYGEDRYLEVRYEDLTQKPELELRRIREFVGIEDHQSLRRTTRGGGRFDWRGNAVGRQFSCIDAGQVGRWRELDPRRIQVLEAVVEKEMELHGYQLELERSAGVHWRALSCRLVNLLRSTLSLWRRKS